MPEVCLVFLLHHPERLRHVRAFDDDADFGNYVDERATTDALRTAASRSFLPALKLLREAAERSQGVIRFGICATGPLLRSAERHHGALMRSLHRLGGTGAVEWIAAPWDHSILGLFSNDHLAGQLGRSADEIQRLFGDRPTTAANTELIYDNAVPRAAATAGMRMVLCGNADRQLAGRTANRVYRAAGDAPVKVLARQVGLSDDWGIRFGDPTWPCHPLKPETYADWITGSLAESGGNVCPIIIHLADLGMTHPKETGIFSFTRRLLGLLVKRGVKFATPAQAGEAAGPIARLDVVDIPQATSGWGPRFDLSPWLGNAMQSNALHLLRQAADRVQGGPGADALVTLVAADHLHAMRHGIPRPMAETPGPAEERRRPSAFESPYDAYLDCTNAVRHLLGRSAARP